MIYKKKREFYRDKVTGLYYVMEYKFRETTPFVDSMEKVTTHGHMLKPSNEFNPEWPTYDFDKVLSTETSDAVGYKAGCLTESLFVTDAVLNDRFEYMGTYASEYSTLATIADYEAECCDFSDADFVVSLALRSMTREGPHQGTCVMHTLIRNYVEHNVTGDKQKELLDLLDEKTNKVK